MRFKVLVNTMLIHFIGLMTFPVWAGTQFYSADIHDANWRSSGDRLECRLSQDIPGYGQALFKHRALQSMEFRVSVRDNPRKSSQALLYVAPPNWKRFSNRKVLGRVAVSTTDDGTIVVPEDWAYRVAYEMREGMETVWTHSDWADGQDLIVAKIRPLRFNSAWDDFKECTANLIDYGYEDVRFSSFFFSKNSMNLSRAEKAKLDKLAEYVSIDRDFQYIKISSHTDSRGLRKINKAVAAKRANLVKNYLVKQGVSPKRFVILAKGEVKPKYNNRTASGRAKNRRVEISLVK